MNYQSQPPYQQNQQNQPQQQPPAYITTKDLAYLKDALSWELLAMKKCHQFAGECKNPQVRQVIEEAGKMHQTHYEILMSHLDPNKTKTNY